ncbi:MAG: 50S ribosomal protein L3 [Candidatus Helarchaeota archaeon]
MGHRKQSAPRHGSLSYRPRKRARNPNGRIKTWPKVYEKESTPILLGFMGYKAGMTHIIFVENRKTSPNYGQEIAKAVTVLDCPPISICAIKAYMHTDYGLKTIGEAWSGELNEDLSRNFPLPKEYDTDKSIVEFEDKLEPLKDSKLLELRLVAHTQPRLTSVPKKKPDLMEIKVAGGSYEELIKYCKDILGNEVRAFDIFKEGQFIDVSAVSKGKGFQGPVKRFGIKILPRKSRKSRRAVGAIGPWQPSRVSYTVARAGQMGFHQRVEYNKRILKIGSDPKEINISGGFLRYGLIKGDYIIVEGSVPGPVKRLIKMRYALRPKPHLEKIPDIVYISTQSKQGK